MSGHGICVLSALACLPAGLAAAVDNETFADRTFLTPGQLTTSEELSGEFENIYPDTLMGAFDQTGTLIEVDDDDSTFGDGLASGLFNIPVNVDGSIDLRVTGLGDDDFFGNHNESGLYELFVQVFDASGATLTSPAFEEGELYVDSADTYAFSNAAWIGGTFTAEIDNTIGDGNNDGGGDVDFFEFSGLIPGEVMLAKTFFEDDGPDTVLGWFDNQGNLIDSDDDNNSNHVVDDGGNSLQSVLEITVDLDGKVVLGVTGYDDFDFIAGSHQETGSYVLTLGTVPEPASLSLFATLGLLIRRRRA
ncbi:MAG: PEP-CTERM sorting domain-containing protein [Algisphaera sp.]